MRTLIFLLAFACPFFCFSQNKFKKTSKNFTNSYYYYKMANEMDINTKRDSALYYYNKSISYFPLPASYAQRALIKSVQGDNIGAFEDYTAAINNCGINDQPEKSTCYYNRATLRLDQRDFDGALSDCRSSLRLDATQFGTVYSLMGQIEYMKGNYQQSMLYCNNVINKYPGGSYDPYLYRGLSQIKLGNNENGCADLSFALEVANKLQIPNGPEYVKQVIKENCK
jgi:tetratricopeptide (TPR) repeat protein